MSTKQFKSEVSELLHLIIHSLYSHPEIFIRELISNASDAIDKLKFLALTELKGAALPERHRIDVRFGKEGGWLSITDTGVGMDGEDLERFLGTIANSGTRKFVEQMEGRERAADGGGEKGADGDSSDLIGKFGVGFYSSFMVAESVTVTSHKAGQDTAWKWVSKGVGTYEIAAAERAEVGTEILLALNERGREFANEYRVKEVITRYSDHISHPIYLTYTKTEYDEKGNEKPGKVVTEQINRGSAIWKRGKSEITEKEYEEFYRGMSHDREPPMMYVHLQAEGTMEYAALLYVPKVAPPNLYYSDFQAIVRLYIQRVFITDDQKSLLPSYLRFVRGVIDSEDLPLNVSREILQDNVLLGKIQGAIVKKLLNKFGEVARKQPQLYANFIAQYNRPLKEGLYQDAANREQLLELARFHSTYVRADGDADGKREGAADGDGDGDGAKDAKASDSEGAKAGDGKQADAADGDGKQEGAGDAAGDFTSLSGYKSRAREGQKYIYYLAGTELARLRRSPLLEPYKRQGVEVLLLDDEMDELVIPVIGPYKELTFRPINKSSDEEDALLQQKRDKKLEQRLAPLKQQIANVLKDRVARVEFSSRLEGSPACIVFSEHAPSTRMKEMLRGMGMDGGMDEKPVLEINAKHEIIAALEALSGAGAAQPAGGQAGADGDGDGAKAGAGDGDGKRAQAGGGDKSGAPSLFEDLCHLLLEQSLLMENIPFDDSHEFVARLNRVIGRAMPTT